MGLARDTKWAGEFIGSGAIVRTRMNPPARSGAMLVTAPMRANVAGPSPVYDPHAPLPATTDTTVSLPRTRLTRQLYVSENSAPPVPSGATATGPLRRAANPGPPVPTRPVEGRPPATVKTRPFALIYR